MQLNKEAQNIAVIAQRAGELIRKKRKNLSVELKGDTPMRDLLTSADLASEEFVVSELEKLYPRCTIIAEERHAADSVADDCFVIDPIDGTINFANGLPLWGVQIACVQGGEVVAAAINLADLNRLYVADENAAYMNGQKISVSDKTLQDGLWSIESHNRCIARREMFAQGYPHLRELFSACTAYAFTASGQYAAMALLGKHPWDRVPGELLVKAAGGVTHSDTTNHIHIAANNINNLEEMKRIIYQCLEDHPDIDPTAYSVY